MKSYSNDLETTEHAKKRQEEILEASHKNIAINEDIRDTSEDIQHISNKMLRIIKVHTYLMSFNLVFTGALFICGAAYVSNLLQL